MLASTTEINCCTQKGIFTFSQGHRHRPPPLLSGYRSTKGRNTLVFYYVISAWPTVCIDLRTQGIFFARHSTGSTCSSNSFFQLGLLSRNRRKLVGLQDPRKYTIVECTCYAQTRARLVSCFLIPLVQKNCALTLITRCSSTHASTKNSSSHILQSNMLIVTIYILCFYSDYSLVRLLLEVRLLLTFIFFLGPVKIKHQINAAIKTIAVFLLFSHQGETDVSANPNKTL